MPASAGALKLRGVYMGLMNRTGITKKAKTEAKAIKAKKGVCAAISFLKGKGKPGRASLAKLKRKR